MATPSNSVRYPMNAETQFMLCRACRNHLATFNNCLGQAFDGLLCRTVDNVRTDGVAAPTLLYGLPAVNVHCNGCNTQIGGRFVAECKLEELMNEIGGCRDRILYWDGTRGLRDAVTHEPVKDPQLHDTPARQQ
ncbi:hypothetical protein V6N13_121412 [Hibiscus sabdariffa]